MTARTPLTEVEYHALARQRVGRAIERLMDERRMSFGDLARATGLSKTGLFKIVDGTSDPTLSSLLRVAQFFGVSIDALLAEVTR
jgi:transcriptional regulator with XRE-family HTH domain